VMYRSALNGKSVRSRLLLKAILGVSVLGAVYSSLPTVAAKDGSDILGELKVFTDVLSIVQRDYVEPVESKKLVEGAIKGMLATLDPHSGYLGPDFYQELQVETSGEFGGLGIEITLKDNLLVVVAPIEGSPAEAKGVRAGDAIIKIDGKFTKDLSLVDAVQKMRGPKGAAIKISVVRKGNPDLIHFTIVRDKIKVKSVRSRALADGFGYIRLAQFQENTAQDLKDGLRKIRAASPGNKIAGIILDMRNNPGGLLNQAVLVSDLFLSEGVVVYTDGRVESQKKKFFAHSRGTEPDYPIIVLVNGGSASASEIVAGALKDHGRALIMGTKTFGKGSVQTVLPLENNGALRITTALYYTKSGRSIQATGVDPDIIVEDQIPEEIEPKTPSRKKLERLRESDLPGAIQNPSITKSKENKQKEEDLEIEAFEKNLRLRNVETVDLRELFEADPIIERAFELMKTFKIFGRDKFLVGSSINK